MQDAELLIPLAEIAGVFVGFGALISIRSGNTGDEYELTMIRMIVFHGILVVITALAPVLISYYDVTGHGLWVASSILFLVLWWIGGNLIDRVDPDRPGLLAAISRRERVRLEIPAVFLWLPMNAALVLILVGPFPDQEPALYLTAVALNLFVDALMLLYVVYQHGRPQRV